MSEGRPRYLMVGIDYGGEWTFLDDPEVWRPAATGLLSRWDPILHDLVRLRQQRGSRQHDHAFHIPLHTIIIHYLWTSWIVQKNPVSQNVCFCVGEWHYMVIIKLVTYILMKSPLRTKIMHILHHHGVKSFDEFYNDSFCKYRLHTSSKTGLWNEKKTLVRQALTLYRSTNGIAMRYHGMQTRCTVLE